MGKVRSRNDHLDKIYHIAMEDFQRSNNSIPRNSHAGKEIGSDQRRREKLVLD